VGTIKRNLKEAVLWFFILLFTGVSYSVSAQAGEVELSGSFSFQQNNYGSETSFQWSRRWTVSAGYSFWDGYEEIELSFTDAFFSAQISGIEDTTYHDQIYSLDFVQAFTSRSSFFQPYIKIGIGQLNRDATSSSGGVAVPTQYDAVTGVLGTGFKLYFTKRVGLKAEVTTYLSGGNINTWQQNFAIYFGLSVYL